MRNQDICPLASIEDTLIYLKTFIHEDIAEEYEEKLQMKEEKVSEIYNIHKAVNE